MMTTEEWNDKPRGVPDPMSDATVEAVARAYCKHMGLNPDEMVIAAIDARLSDVSQWWRYERRVREAMHLAIKEVLG